MEIESRLEDDVLVLTPQEKRLDANGTVAFKERVHELSAGHGGRLLLDMVNIQFLDSSGLGALVAVMKSLGEGRELELSNCAPAVMRVLTLTRMDRIFLLRDGAASPHGTAA
ncbi:MAG: STAS domain-containing protein [Pseudomonadota bacterium]